MNVVCPAARQKAKRNKKREEWDGRIQQTGKLGKINDRSHPMFLGATRAPGSGSAEGQRPDPPIVYIMI